MHHNLKMLMACPPVALICFQFRFLCRIYSLDRIPPHLIHNARLWATQLLCDCPQRETITQICFYLHALFITEVCALFVVFVFHFSIVAEWSDSTQNLPR